MIRPLSRKTLLRTAASTAAAALLALLAGCGTASGNGSSPIAQAGLSGLVHGGQQPLEGSTIQIYQAGTTDYGTGATALLTSNVTTGSDGMFNITEHWTCTPGSMLYITASGGDAGPNPSNSAINIMAALGICGSVTPSSYISINELTTVSAVWALAPFMNGSDIGAPSTNAAGLAAAFNDAAKLADWSTGMSPGASLPSGVTVPTKTLNTLANIIATCVNSDHASDPGCSTLFANTTPSGGSAPGDTLAAALYMAQNPTVNVSTLVSAAVPAGPFQPTYSSLNDLTVGITYNVGSSPSGIAIDASGNAWVANSGSNFVSEIERSSGARVDVSGAGITTPKGIAIDLSGNIWTANSTVNTLSAFSVGGTPLSNSPYSGGGLSAPAGLAVDPLGYIWAANSGAGTVSVFNASGTPVSDSGHITSGSTGASLAAVAISPQ